MLEVAPHRVSLIYSSSGKPLLAREHGANICFNVSHTRGMGLLAVGQWGELGVDVEAHDDSRELDAVARRNFSVSEQEVYFAAPTLGERVCIFFDTWAGKEACVKATGGGITSDLQRFSVGVAAPGTERAVSFDGDEAESRRWGLVGLPMPDGYSGAVAVRAAEGSVPNLVENPPLLFDVDAGKLESGQFV